MRELLEFIREEGFVLFHTGHWYSPKYRTYLPRVIQPMLDDEALLKLFGEKQLKEINENLHE